MESSTIRTIQVGAGKDASTDKRTQWFLQIFLMCVLVRVEKDLPNHAVNDAPARLCTQRLSEGPTLDDCELFRRNLHGCGLVDVQVRL
jgi:hypothetical protein